MDRYELCLLSSAAKDPKIGETATRYLNLRNMMSDACAEEKLRFRKEFSNYYRLHAAFLSKEWKDKYFELLFSFGEKMPPEAHRVALLELSKFPRLKGDEAAQFSFVSKLVGIHDEQQPIFDRFVQHFFGLGPPSLGPLEFRISGFVRNLNEIAMRYRIWIEYEPFAAIIRELRCKYPHMAECHPHRICDWLVWIVGKDYETQKSKREMAKGV